MHTGQFFTAAVLASLAIANSALAQLPAPQCPAANVSRDGMAITFRDLGVMLHHTRNPFRLTAEYYAALVNGDSNWTGQSFQDGFRGADLIEETIRFARSDGVVERFGGDDTDILTPDVVMAVVEVPAASPTRMCQREEVCVISYHGTDREHLFQRDEIDHLSDAGRTWLTNSA